VKLRLLAVGRIKSPAFLELIQTYAERLRPFVPLRTEEVRDFPVRKGMSVKVAVDVEGQALSERISEESPYIVLDERGKQKTTEEWADLFRRFENQGAKEMTFVIGGAYGLSESLLRGAKERLALSKLTFPHELARLVFLEQVYRVYTVLRGIPYHHGDVI
jgi:23S rRNA (pseudouridine1915-N3)-methyltransferase